MEGAYIIYLRRVETKLEEIISLKNEGNAFIKANIQDDAIEKYNKAKDLAVEIDLIYRDHLVNHKEKDDFKKVWDEFIRQKTFVYSNLALCYQKLDQIQQSIEFDLKVNTFLNIGN